MKKLDQALIPRGNAFNVIRLILASSVIVWHAIFLGGWKAPAHLAFGSDIGVDGFFVISGFLITRSWDRGRSAIRYVWHRFLRIFPGFWVCLLVTVGAGAVAWTHDHGQLAGFTSAPAGPFDYLKSNWYLNVRQWSISGTPARVPYPRFWDTPLWTLRWEFECYIGILVLGSLRLIHPSRRFVIGALFALSYLLLLALHFHPALDHHLPGQLQGGVVRFMATFLAGAAIYSYRSSLPADQRIAAACAVVVAIALVFIRDYRILALVPMAYLIIWLGGCNRGPGLTNKHDISYGVYIYGYIGQQLLAIYGATKLGYVPYMLLGLAAAVPFATVSWLAIERPALSLKNWNPRRGVIERDPAIPDAAQ